jgi:two-component system response regulator AdeR
MATSIMQKNKVAIIEDELSIQQMYKFKLEKEGYDVKVANNGIEGLELVKTFEPQLILLDLKMPQMGGDEMLQLLRQEEWGAAIKVIILTNISKNEAPHMLRFLSVERYVVKAHYTPSQVAAIVHEVIRG